MVKPKNMLVFGATGNTGTPFVEQALVSGDFNVTVYIRSFDKLKERLGLAFVAKYMERMESYNQNVLKVIIGNIEDNFKVQKAIEHKDIVISFAGGPHSNRKYPKGMMINFVRQVIVGCRAHGCERFIYQAGAFSPTPDKPLNSATKIMRNVLGRLMGITHMLRDNDAVIKYLHKHVYDIKWTVTRPGMLTEGDSKGTINAKLDKMPMSGSVRFVDLAEFTLREATYGLNVRKCPYIVYM